MPSCVLDGDATTLRNPEQRESLESYVIDETFQILDPALERNVLDIVVGKAIATLVVAQQTNRIRGA
jgi:hypothetical protein